MSNAEFWDWATGDDHVTVYEVTRETYGSDNPHVLGDIRYYNFGQDSSDWTLERAEEEADRLCNMHNQAARDNNALALSLCDLIASGGIADPNPPSPA